MPDLRPFRALRYDAARAPDLSAVLCPPYDVISAAEREHLLSRSPANAVRLELPAPTTESATDADYERAAATLAGWLGDGTLRREDRPALYVYEQRFLGSDGATRVARSFFCRLRLEKYGPDGTVLPHERTHAGPREHRFRLLRAVRTHLSPVLLLYDDRSGGADAAALLDVLTARAADVEATGPDGVAQRLWVVDPALSAPADRLLELAAHSELYIADGHHRYETALRYRDAPGSETDAQFVLALLYEARSGGLKLAPWHRVVYGVPDATGAFARADELFVAEPVDEAQRLLELLSAGEEAGVLAVWTRAGGALLQVDRARVAPLVAGAGSEAVRWLDVSVLSGTLGRMIGSTESQLSSERRLAYTHDAREALRRVDRGEADVAYLLRPTPVDQVLAVAGARDFMPPKSTYFHPKAATGLVFDPLFE